jgi:hypothetical protein
LFITDFKLSSYSFLKWILLVEVGCVADVLEEHAASIFSGIKLGDYMQASVVPPPLAFYIYHPVVFPASILHQYQKSRINF